MLLKINLQNLYKYFFYLFVFFLPLQSRKVFLTSHSFYTGSFTEYGTIFLYLSDLLFVMSLVSLCLFNRGIIKKSSDKLKSKSGIFRSRQMLVLLVVFILWIFMSAFHDWQYLELSLFRSLKLFEMMLLAAFIHFVSYKKRFFITSLFIVSLSGFFQSFLAIYQFLYQESAFSSPLLHKLTGETILSSALPGIAKITIEGGKLIRAYGTFPHPNILGGFLVFSIFITIYLYHEHKNDYLSSKYLQLKNVTIRQHIIFLFWFILFSAQFLALLLSFSRSAWLGFLFGIFFLFFISVKIVSRETISMSVLAKYLTAHKELLLAILMIFILAIGQIELVSKRIAQDISLAQIQGAEMPQNDAFGDRVFFNNVSRETISNNPIFGSGPGTSIFQISDYYSHVSSKNNALEPWQYQPAHNIYLLCASEVGIVGFLLLFFMISRIMFGQIKKIVSRETIYSQKVLKTYALSVMVVFMIIGFFDHYFWTSQQGAIMFWLILGVNLA